MPVALNSRLPNQITYPAGSGSEAPIANGLDLLAIPGDQMGTKEKCHAVAPIWCANCRCPNPAVRTQLVMMLCVPRPRCKRQHSHARVYPGSGHGAVHPAKGCARALHCPAPGVPVVGGMLTLLSAPICIPQAHGSCSFSLRVFPQDLSIHGTKDTRNNVLT